MRVSLSMAIFTTVGGSMGKWRYGLGKCYGPWCFVGHATAGISLLGENF